MRWLDLIAAFLCYLSIGLVVGFIVGQKTQNKGIETQVITKTDTCVVYDTITREKPLFTRVEVIRYDTVTVRTPKDTVYVSLPVERKEYTDTSYKVIISGINPSLDYISVYQKTQYINTERKTYVQPSKWSFAVSAGPSVLITPKGNVYGGLGGTVGLAYTF